jgi:glycosyltransferase involved in cell wall biosynthesis
MIEPLIVIPVYNHELGLASMLEGLAASHLPCLLVDDGSNAPCAQALRQMADAHPSWLHLLRLEVNGGKGAAMLAGFAWAHARGYAHVLQIDADGQHAVADIPRFVAVAQSHPQALILGTPEYDASVPRGRLIGRYATHIWVWINTLSLVVRDSMCGFRVYPLAPVRVVLAQEKVGLRMDFDAEIVVRLVWRGVDVVNLPTPVRYPADGISHFRLWRDNAMISRMHARLFFGMLWRWPRLLWRRSRALSA